MNHRQVFSVFDHSVNIPENRFLKHTSERLVNHFVRDTSNEGLRDAGRTPPPAQPVRGR